MDGRILYTQPPKGHWGKKIDPWGKKGQTYARYRKKVIARNYFRNYFLYLKLCASGPVTGSKMDTKIE